MFNRILVSLAIVSSVASVSYGADVMPLPGFGPNPSYCDVLQQFIPLLTRNVTSNEEEEEGLEKILTQYHGDINFLVQSIEQAFDRLENIQAKLQTIAQKEVKTGQKQKMEEMFDFISEFDVLLKSIDKDKGQVIDVDNTLDVIRNVSLDRFNSEVIGCELVRDRINSFLEDYSGNHSAELKELKEKLNNIVFGHGDENGNKTTL